MEMALEVVHLTPAQGSRRCLEVRQWPRSQPTAWFFPLGDQCGVGAWCHSGDEYAYSLWRPGLEAELGAGEGWAQ